MERTAVTSSAVVSIGYDAATSTLEVEYKGARVYRYTGVSQERYDAIRTATSIGSALNALKAEGVPCERVEEQVA